MPDAAWAIGLFGGIPAALIFLFWWIRRWDLRGRQLRRPYLHRLAETGSRRPSAVDRRLEQKIEHEAGTRDAPQNHPRMDVAFEGQATPKSRPSPLLRRRWSESRPVAIRTGR